MMSYRKRTGKDSAGFSVLFLAVAEKEGIRSAVAMSQPATLSDEATLQGGIVRYMGAAADNKIIGNNPMSNNHRSSLVADDTAVSEAIGAADNCIISYEYAIDVAGVANGYVVTYPALTALLPGGIFINKDIKAFYQGRPMPVHRKHIGNLGTQTVINLDFAAAGFTEHRHFYTISEAAGALTYQEVHILNIGMGSDGVIGHVIGYILNEGIVPYGYIVQSCITQTGVLSDASGKGKHSLKAPKLHGAGKADIAHVVKGFGM